MRRPLAYDDPDHRNYQESGQVSKRSLFNALAQVIIQRVKLLITAQVEPRETRPPLAVMRG